MSQLFQPIYCSIINCFGDIKTAIESTVIGSSKDNHDLPCLMLHSTNFNPLMSFQQQFRIDKKCLMSQKLGAFARLLFETDSGLLLEDMAVREGYTVPYFRCSLMDVIDSCQIQVLFVPTKKSLPCTYITVGFSYALHLRCQGIPQ